MLDFLGEIKNDKTIEITNYIPTTLDDLGLSG